MSYNTYFDIGAIILILVLATHFFTTQSIKNKETVMFAHMLTATLLAAIFDVLSASFGARYGEVPIWVNYLCDEVYLVATNGITYVYYAYIYILTKKKDVGFWRMVGVGFPYVVEIVLILSSPYTGWIFNYDDGSYAHGELSIFLYIVSFGYILASIVRTFVFRKALSKGRAGFIICYTLVMLVMVIFQALYPTLMIVQYGAAISCLIIYFSLENPAAYKDPELNIYNLRALYEIYHHGVRSGRHFQVFAIKVEGLKDLSSLFGLEVQDEILQDVADVIDARAQEKQMFRISEEEFCVFGKKSSDDWEILKSNLGNRFRQPFVFRDMEINLGARMCLLQHPQEWPKADDALDMIRLALHKATTDSEQPIVLADEMELEEGRRDTYIIQAMKRALENHGFDIYYQPIYSTREGRFVQVEALIRLFDERLGKVGPDEFIPLAEKKGLITEIGAYVFSEVCTMLKREQLWEWGIERVDVNLSGIQCMQENLAERLIDIMDAYKVPYKAITFEVTETAAVISKTALRRNMEILLQKGINFSMDDYGSGYSNTMTIIDYPFSDVKLDKSMLWSAMGNTQAMQALKHTISMLDDMGFEIIAEGVETTEMAAKLQALGCTLHQGFYYAKPLAEEEFIQLVKNC